MAARRVEVVQAQPDLRVLLAAACYPEGLIDYGQAESTFLRWELDRGVLDPVRGSAWWRAINDRLLTDKVEAHLLYVSGGGRASTASARAWFQFLCAPAPLTWYRAHNHSVVSGYLENQALVEAEVHAERFMINVTLARVLFTHALIERPALALGPFAGVGPRIADPRGGSVSLFLDLRDVFPAHYPLHDMSVQDVLEGEGATARAIDFGLILPKVDALYAFAASTLNEPRLLALIERGVFQYGHPNVDLNTREVPPAVRWLRVATKARPHAYPGI